MSETKEKYGISVEMCDFGQNAFEKFQMATIKASRDAYFAFSDTNGVTASAHVRGETVREAIRHGIIAGLEIDKVGQLKPYVVEWLANEIQKHIKRITTAPIDPN